MASCFCNSCDACIDRMGVEYDAQMRGHVKPSERAHVEPVDTIEEQYSANLRNCNRGDSRAACDR